VKVALFLEESGLPYKLFPIDASRGEQHSEAFKQINPSGKVPTIVDTDGVATLRVARTHPLRTST